jgi:hypothetical protein
MAQSAARGFDLHQTAGVTLLTHANLAARAARDNRLRKLAMFTIGGKSGAKSAGQPAPFRPRHFYRAAG